MRVNKIRALHGYRTRHYTAGEPSALVPNLVKRNFDVSRPNRVCVTDITYIRTWEGWLYLAIVMDLFSRKIVGWSTRPTIHRQLVLDSVLMAVKRRRPRGTVIHSDQGCQYSSDDWRRFFSSLKKGRIKKRIYKNRELANADIYDYIDSFYNPSRRHKHLGGVSPEEFEAAAKRR